MAICNMQIKFDESWMCGVVSEIYVDRQMHMSIETSTPQHG